MEQATSYGLASVSLIIATKSDLNFFKLILLSRVANQSLKWIGKESGLFKPVSDDDRRKLTVEALSVVFFASVISYIYMVQPNMFDSATKNTLTRGATISS